VSYILCQTMVAKKNPTVVSVAVYCPYSAVDWWSRDGGTQFYCLFLAVVK